MELLPPSFPSGAIHRRRYAKHTCKGAAVTRPLLIVHADDLGYQPERDEGIFEACASGVVTSTSLLVNGASAVKAAERARGFRQPEGVPLCVGLHLNLTEGVAVSDDRQLLGKTGFWQAAEAAVQRKQAQQPEQMLTSSSKNRTGPQESTDVSGSAFSPLSLPSSPLLPSPPSQMLTSVRPVPCSNQKNRSRDNCRTRNMPSPPSASPVSPPPSSQLLTSTSPLPCIKHRNCHRSSDHCHTLPSTPPCSNHRQNQSRANCHNRNILQEASSSSSSSSSPPSSSPASSSSSSSSSLPSSAFLTSEWIVAEVRAQVLLFIELMGRPPTHVDGHNHVHVFPMVLDALIKVMVEYRIRWLRLPDEDVTDFAWASEEQRLFHERIALCGSRARQRLRSEPLLSCPTHFFGIRSCSTSDQLIEQVERIIAEETTGGAHASEPTHGAVRENLPESERESNHTHIHAHSHTLRSHSHKHSRNHNHDHCLTGEQHRKHKHPHPNHSPNHEHECNRSRDNHEHNTHTHPHENGHPEREQANQPHSDKDHDEHHKHAHDCQSTNHHKPRGCKHESTCENHHPSDHSHTHDSDNISTTAASSPNSHQHNDDDTHSVRALDQTRIRHAPGDCAEECISECGRAHKIRKIEEEPATQCGELACVTRRSSGSLHTDNGSTINNSSGSSSSGSGTSASRIIIECMTHPGYISALGDLFSKSEDREAELRVLLSPALRHFVRDNVRLTSFRDLVNNMSVK